MRGNYLRTNFRKTLTSGPRLDIIGKGITQYRAASAHADPCGGFLMFSYIDASAGKATAAVTAGLSYAVGDSTYGTLSRYYGEGKFGSGYLFYPLGIHTLSISTVAMGDLAAGSTLKYMKIIDIQATGSIWIISLLHASYAGSFCAIDGGANDALRLLIYGFVISIP